jgi:hypothetical protein
MLYVKLKNEISLPGTPASETSAGGRDPCAGGPMTAASTNLHFHGLAWQFLYNTTGEETPAGQINGFIQYLGKSLTDTLRTLVEATGTTYPKAPSR